MLEKPPSTARLEAFSDGVIAVIITIMVLELKVPHEDGVAGLYAIVRYSFVCGFDDCVRLLVFLLRWSVHRELKHTGSLKGKTRGAR